jgi:tRNA(Ile)-lysidine synthase
LAARYWAAPDPVTTPMSDTALPPAPDPGAPVLVGFSGGLDSTVLLHWLSQQPAVIARGLRAVHVHHGLQDAADHWSAHCQAVCDALGIAMVVCPVQVRADGRGLEAAARDARRQAFAQALRPGEWLALAHHRDDQAETFLLRALRGSGTDGLAAMREHAQLAGHELWRPLLAQPRAALLAHARHHHLHWVEDPSNAATDFDRNFLRAQVLPLLAQRWPHAAASLAASAARCAEDASVLGTDDAQRLAALLQADGSLSISALAALPAAARARAVRLWLRQLAAPPLPGHLHALLDAQVLGSGFDRSARLAWHGMQLQRWRDGLYLRWPRSAPAADWSLPWDGRAPLRLADGGVLHLHQAPDGFATPVCVRLRQGGERITLPGRNHQHALKDCLQRADLPPWLRCSVPLLFDGPQLLCAADVVIGAGFAPPRVPAGAWLQWQRPDAAD